LSSIRQFTLFFDIVTHQTHLKKFVEKGYFGRIRKITECSLETTIQERALYKRNIVQYQIIYTFLW